MLPWDSNILRVRLSLLKANKKICIDLDSDNWPLLWASLVVC
jgi:hypothetical protein